MVIIDGDIRYIDVVLSAADIADLKDANALYALLKSRGMEFIGLTAPQPIGTIEIIQCPRDLSVTYRQTINDIDVDID